MNIFVLSTGRCGSKSFAAACAHITNYTSGHETRTGIIGPGRLKYPKNHIEVDNRLCWFLGRLNEAYGNAAYYVHLERQTDPVVRSLNRRWHLRENIVRAYADQIHMTTVKNPKIVCEDYIRTVTSNITMFLENKENVLKINIEEAETGFTEFWNQISADGDLKSALNEFSTQYNQGAKIGIEY